MNNRKFQTVYETSYGQVISIFKNEMSFSEAVDKGKEYCKTNGFKYIRTEVTN